MFKIQNFDDKRKTESHEILLGVWCLTGGGPGDFRPWFGPSLSTPKDLRGFEGELGVLGESRLTVLHYRDGAAAG